MAAKEILNSKRRFSLNIISASKTTELRPKIWTTQNDTPEGSSQTGNGKLIFKKTSLARRKNKTPNTKSTKSRRPPIAQVPEVHLSWSEKYLSWRYVMAFLLQTSFVVVVFLRNCLPMALVCMVKPRRQSPTSNRTGDWLSSKLTSNELTYSTVNDSSNRQSIFHDQDSNDKDGTYEFNWDSDVQGLILTSNLFTSFLGPLLITFVVDRVGSKLTLTIFNLVSCVLTLLCPIAARISPYLLIGLRMLMGITLGANVPVIGDSLAWWAPQAEKLTMVALTFSGMNIGGILASSISGFLCYIPLDNGWPFIFYIFGALGILWGIAWHFLSSRKPEEHPYISEKEKEYIVSHRIGMESTKGGKTEKPPYCKILTSVPVLAFLMVGSCQLWTLNLTFTYLPVYFTDVLGFPIEIAGVLVSLSNLCRMFGTFMWTAIGNKLMRYFSTNRVRKICFCVGFTLCAANQVGVAFFDKDDKWVAFGLLIVVRICQSVSSCTVPILPLDMAPRYSAFLTGLFMSVGSCVSISAPLLTSAITTNGTYEEWRTVWIITGAVIFSAVLVFAFFAEAKIQPWAQVNKPNLPHIVSPFITMGRRFSTFMEAPPISPAPPINAQKFDFTIAVQASAADVVPGLATPSSETNIAALNFEKKIPSPSNSAENFPGSDTESGDEEDGDEDENNKGISNMAFEEDESYIPARKRAYSEFGLEVLRQQMKEEEATVVSVDNPTVLLDNSLLNQNRNNHNEQNRFVSSLPTKTEKGEGISNKRIEIEENNKRESKTFDCTRL